MNKRKTVLIATIEDAWSSVKYPGKKNITFNAYNDEGITDYFAGTTWRRHTAENLRRHSSAISSFFTPVAWHYWLPAYLIAAVENIHELSQGFDSVVYSLDRNQSNFSKRLELLSTEQIEALIQVLELTCEAEQDTPGFYSSSEWKLLEYFYSVHKNQ